MKWTYFVLIIATVLIEAFILTKLKVSGLEIPLLWLVCQFLLISHWIEYRQLIILGAIGGYLLDILASFRQGSEFLVLLTSIFITIFILTVIKKKYFNLPINFWVVVFSNLYYVLARFVMEFSNFNFLIISRLFIYWVLIIVIFYFFNLSIRWFSR